MIGTITVQAERPVPVSLEATLDPEFKIYSSYGSYVDLVKSHITAVVTYSDGSTLPLEPSQFSLNGDWAYHEGVEDGNEFDVSCIIDGVELDDSFTTTVQQQSFYRIEATFEQTAPVPSSAKIDQLENYGTLTVRGYISEDDAVGRVLDEQQYDVSGSFWTGAAEFWTGTEDNGGKKDVTIRISDEQTGRLTDDIEVEVQYIEPSSLSYNDYKIVYNAGEKFDKSQADLIILYLSQTPVATRPMTDQEYEVIYPENRDHFEFGDTSVTIRYIENGQHLELDLPITVAETIVYEPNFNNNPGIYSGEDQFRAMSGFDEAAMYITVSRDGVPLASGNDYTFEDDDGDGIWEFHATDAGIYRIEVDLRDGYRWSMSDEVVFEWQIQKAYISPTLEFDNDSWEYAGPDGADVGYTVSGNPGNGGVTVYYWGTANDPSQSIDSEDRSTEQPYAAGIWYAVAYVEETDNYRSGNTEASPVEFTITRKSVQPPTAAEQTYTGSGQTVDVSDFSQSEVGFTVSSQEGEDVGYYNATLTMDADDAYNHEWTGGSWDGGVNTVTVQWHIGPAEIPVPTPNEAGPWTYSEDDVPGTGDTKTVTFGSEGIGYHITGADNGATFDGLSVSASQHGTYTITFALDDKKNLVWSDGGTGEKPYKWTIGKATNTVTVPSFAGGSTFTYGDDIALSSESEFGTPYFMYRPSGAGDFQSFTEGTHPDVGTYDIKACVAATGNYDYVESVTTTFTITKEANSIEIVEDSDAPLDKTYDGSQISDPKVNVTDGSIHYEYASSEGGPYTQGLPTEAGHWYVRAVVTGSTNYEDATSDSVEVFIDWIAIPYPTVQGDLVFNGTEEDPDGTAQTPTLVLDFSGYPVGEGQDDALVVNVTPQTDHGDYSLTVSPGDNYRWETLVGDSYRYGKDLDWSILQQSVRITIEQRAEEYHNGQAWSPTVPTSNKYIVSAAPTDYEIDQYRDTLYVTLISDNYKWELNGDVDTYGDPYDSIDPTNPLKMYIGYDITQTRYTIKYTQLDWTYGESMPEATIVPSVDDEGVWANIRDPEKHRVSYRPVLDDGAYGEVMDGVPEDAGSYVVSITVFETDTYAAIQSEWSTFTISPAEISIGQIVDKDITYDGNGHDATEFIANFDDVVTTKNNQEASWHFSLTDTQGKELFSDKLSLMEEGEYTVYYYVSAPNHNDSEIGSFTATVIPREITIQIGSPLFDEDGNIIQNGKVYDGCAPTGDEISGIVYSISSGTLGAKDSLEDLNIELTITDADADAGTYTVTGEANNHNYNVTVNSGSYQIVTADMTIGDITATSPMYDNVAYSLSNIIEGLPETIKLGDSEDTITWSFRIGDEGGFDDQTVTDVGTYFVYYQGASDNYNTYTSDGYVEVTVQKRALSVTVNNAEVEYGREAPSFSVTYDNFAAGHDGGNGLSLSLTYSHDYIAGANAGYQYYVSVTVSGNDTFAKNYDVTLFSGTLKVIPRQVTATIQDVSITYGNPEPEFLCRCADMYGDDDIMDYVTLGIRGHESIPTDVGTYAIVGSDMDPSDNYEVTFGDEGEFRIDPISVTIFFDGATSSTYTGSPIEMMYHFEHNDEIYNIDSDLVEVHYRDSEGKDLDGPPTDAGQYTFAVQVTSGNYSASASSSTTFTISPASYGSFYGQTIHVVATEPIFNGSPQNPDVYFTDQNGDTVESHDLEIEYEGSPTHVSEGRADVTVTVTSTNPNVYAPNSDGYTYTTTSYVRVQPLDVTVSWPEDDYEYNGLEQKVDATCIIDGKTVHLVTTPYSDDDHFVKEGGIFRDHLDGGYTFTATFGDDFEGESTDYSIENPTRVYHIQKRPVSVVAEDASKVYGDPVDTGKFTWVYVYGSKPFVDSSGTEVPAGSDSVGLGFSTDANASSAVSDDSHTYVIRIDSTEADTRNYEISTTPGTLTITHRPITISVVGQSAVYTGSEPTVLTNGLYEIVSGSVAEGLPASIVLGKEEGTDVGFYDITVTYDSNYIVTITDGERKFEITGAPITATASYGGFEYDGEVHSTSDFTRSQTSAIPGASFSWEFSFDGSDYSDSLTFSDVGHYTVHYKVTADNHEPSEGTVEFDVTIGTNYFDDYEKLTGWTFDDISQDTDVVLPVPDSRFGEVETTIYEAVIGSDGDVDVDSTIAQGQIVDGFSTGMDAGTYLVVFAVEAGVSSHDPSLKNYEAISESYQVVVSQKPVSVSWEPSEFEFTNNPISNTITIENYMQFGDTTEGVEAVVSGNTMTMYASAVGTYTVTVTLTDDNYRWSDPDQDDVRSCTVGWSIYYGEDSNEWTVNLSLNSWPYDGTYHSPHAEAKYGTVYYVYSTDENGPYDMVPFTDSGSYWVKAVVDAGLTYGSIESAPLNYHIWKVDVTEPTVTGLSFTYDGSVKAPTVSGFDAATMYMTGASATDAGNYTLRIGLLDTVNHQWSDGSVSDLSFPWSIGKAVVQTPGYGDEGGHLTFDGTFQTYPFTHDGNVSVDGYTGTNASRYEAVFSITDANYRWAEDLVLRDGNYVLEWWIDPKPVPGPELTREVDAWTGVTLRNVVKNMDPMYMGYDPVYGNLLLDVDGSTVTLVTAQAGTYSASFYLKSTNYEWEEGTVTDENGRVVLTWTVNPMEVTLGAGDNTFTYTGTEHQYTPDGLDRYGSVITIKDDRRTGVGNYTAVLTLTDTRNYVWNEGMNVDPDDRAVAYLPWYITADVFDIASLDPKLTFIYDGLPHSPDFGSLPSWITATSRTTITDAGTSEIIVDFAADEGYELTSYSATYTVTVTSKPVTITVDNATMRFGDEIPGFTYEVSGGGFLDRDNVTVTVTTDYADGNDCGGYAIRVNHNAGGNYAVTTEDGTLTVLPAFVDIPSDMTVDYTGEPVDQPFSGPYDVTGDMTGTDPGTYDVTLTLDKNHVWSDGSNDPIYRTWTIRYPTDHNDWTVPLSLDSWIYDGTYHEPHAEARFGTAHFLYSTEEDGTYTSVPFVDSGVYYVKAVVDAGPTYGELESDPLRYEIFTIKVPVPEVSGDKSYTYDGTAKGLTVSDHDPALVSVTGSSATDAGNYTLRISLTDTRNHEWDTGGSDDITVDWSIAKAVAAVPGYGSGDGHLTYDGTEQTYPFAYDGNVSVSGDSSIDASGYTAVFTLLYPDNYRWADGLEDDERTLEWWIDPKPVPAPYLDRTTDVYDPDGLDNFINGLDTGIMMPDTSGCPDVLMGVYGEHVNLTTYQSGEYVIPVHIIDDNYTWAPGSVLVDGNVELVWNVNPIELNLGTGTNIFTYDGEGKEYVPTGYDPSLMGIEGNTGKDVGSYQARVTIGDPRNYVWSGSMVLDPEDPATALMVWYITSDLFDPSVLDPVLEFVYDGEEHVPDFGQLPDWLHVSFGEGVVDAGTGKVTVYFDADAGHILSVSSVTYDVTVLPMKVIIEVHDIDVTFGGDMPEPTFDFLEGGFLERDGVTVSLSVGYDASMGCGSFPIVLDYHAGDNYDVHVNEGTLTVHPIEVPEPEVTTVVYTGEEVGHPFDGPFTVEGELTGKDVRAYHVTLTLDANHVWWDGTVGPKDMTWLIVSGSELMYDYFYVDTSPETYTGDDITKTVRSLNPSIIEDVDFTVEYKDNKDAGTATITITGIGAHTGTLTYEFEIEPMQVPIPVQQDVVYTGKAQDAPFEKSPLYKMGGDLSAMDVGDYTVMFDLKDTRNTEWSDGTIGQKEILWRIVPGTILIEDMFFVDTEPETYTGEEITKLVRSADGQLAEGTDYEVSYEKNVDVGTATITITGIGAYTGTLTYEFEIQKATPVLVFGNDSYDRRTGDGAFTVLPYMSPYLGLDDIVWSSDDESVATVDPGTGEVTMVGPGTVTITATVPGTENYEGVSDSYVIDVTRTTSGSGGSHTVVIRDNVYVTFTVDTGLGYEIVDYTDDSVSFTAFALEGYEQFDDSIAVTAEGVEVVPEDGVYTVQVIGDTHISITHDPAPEPAPVVVGGVPWWIWLVIAVLAVATILAVLYACVYKGEDDDDVQ